MSKLHDSVDGSSEAGTPTDALTPEALEREQARKRVERKRKLRADIFAYLVVNTGLIVLWATTGRGSFWPGWVLGIWGALLLLDIWDVHIRRPVLDEDIDDELRRLHRRR